MVLPRTDGPLAVAVAEKIRQCVEGFNIEYDGGQVLKMTISVGVATYTGSAKQGFSSQQLVESADKAMYAAKSAGGNKVFQSQPIDQAMPKAS